MTANRNRFTPGVENLEVRYLLSANPLLVKSTPGPPVEVARHITHSPEFLTNQVTETYQHFLKRVPEASGRDFWVQALESGMTDAQLEAAFISSPEYLAGHGGGGSAWIEAIYQDLCGRTPDQQGRDFWLQSLNGGASRLEVGFGIASSTERAAKRIDQAYEQLLGRAPTPAEEMSWLGQVPQGPGDADLMAGIISSDDYIQAHGENFWKDRGLPDPRQDYQISSTLGFYGGTPARYLEQHASDSTAWLFSVYQDILNRKPDVGGLGFYLHELDGNIFSAKIKSSEGNPSLISS
jgi:hypothetical protein